MLVSTKLHEVENGLRISDGPIFTGGPSSPVGLDFPVDTIYGQNLGNGGVVLWRKYNTGINDWTRILQNDFYQRAEALGNTTNASTTTYVTKSSLTTPSLPLGNYIFEFSFRLLSSAANRGCQVDIQDNTVSVLNFTEFVPNVGELPMRHGFVFLNNISGVHTLALLFRAAVGASTQTMSNARIFFRRFE
jgi:hypothetical protein